MSRSDRAQFVEFFVYVGFVLLFLLVLEARGADEAGAGAGLEPVRPARHGRGWRATAKVALLVGLMHGAATLDAWSTNRALRRNPLARELNPLGRPFVGKPSIYFAVQIAPLAADVWMLKRPRSRRAKWAAAALAAGHFAGGVHNVRLANRWRDGQGEWRRGK